MGLSVPTFVPEKHVKKLSKIFVKVNNHLSMYAYESSMKVSFGGTVDTRTACGALKKIKEIYLKRTKIFEYKTKSIGMQQQNQYLIKGFSSVHSTLVHNTRTTITKPTVF